MISRSLLFQSVSVPAGLILIRALAFDSLFTAAAAPSDVIRPDFNTLLLFAFIPSPLRRRFPQMR